MKKISLLLLVLLYQSYSFGQQYQIKGKVAYQNKMAVEFVISSLLNNQKKLIAQTTTDSLGNFSIKAEKGNYLLQLEQFGTEYLNKEITINQTWIWEPLKLSNLYNLMV